MQKSSIKARIFALAIIVAMLCGPMVAVQASSYSITGTIIDGDDSYLSNVLITVYSELAIVSGDSLQGNIVSTTTSDAYGNFKLGLERASYTVVFKKAGYETITLNINLGVATELTYSLGKITMEKSLGISSTASTLLIHDGETFSIPITVSNNGEDDAVSITAATVDGYSATVLNSANQQVSRVLIPAGGSASLTVKVIAPMNASDADIVVTVASAVEVDYVVHLHVVGVNGEALSSTYTGRSVLPDESVDFTVVLKNPLYYSKTFQLSVNSPELWVFYVENGEGQKINAVTLGAGESVNLHVIGDVPNDAATGDYKLSVNATYESKTDSLPLTVTVNVTSPEFSITSKYPSQTLSLGGSATYSVTITNPGATQLVKIKAEGVPSGWTVAFKSSAGVRINSLLIAGDSSEEVQVVVTPSLDSTNAEHAFDVTAYSDYTSGTITLAANIGGSFSLDISVDSLYFETNAATTTTDVVTLTNTGYSSINNLELEITSPDGWDVVPSPIKVTTLEPNEKAIFTLSITPPTGTSAKDYLVKVSATSDEVSTDEQSIRVTVNVESSWSIYGLLLLAAGGGLFWLLYKKLKRK